MHLKIQNTNLLNIAVENGSIKTAHFHKDIELIMVIEGTMEVLMEEKIYYLSEEDCILINSNCRHRCQIHRDACFLRVAISYEEMQKLLGHQIMEFQCNSVSEEAAKDPAKYEQLKSFLRKFLNIYFQKEEHQVLMYQNLSYQCISLLVERFLVYLGDEARIALDSDEARYMEIMNYIETQYGNDISLHDLAQRLHLSVSYLSRYIKNALGCNFIQYLNKVRLEHAVEDLLYSDAVITKIALDNGFSNVAVFNKKFKECYGETPSAYRKKKRVSKEVRNEKNDANRLMTSVESYLAQHQDKEIRENENIYMPVKVDVTKKQELHKNWNQVINIGAAQDLLLSSVQEHILILKKELGFEYVRFWNIFGADMHVIDEQRQHYNFSNIFRILDFLVHNGLKPYIELGFKPKQIISNIQESRLKIESEIPIDTLENFAALFENFMQHLLQRYGEEEVNSWYFENWGDKRLLDARSSLNYFELFNTVYDQVKNYAPKAKVGGAGVSINDHQCRRLEGMLTQWQNAGRRPDFLSVYLYPYERTFQGEHMYVRQMTETSFLTEQLQCARQCIRQMGFEDAELHVTEWNMTLSNRNYMNDSCFKAVYLAKSISEMTTLADRVVYFLGTDLFSDYYDTNKILYGGAGLISQDGIFKPAFYAFKYMNRLGGHLIYADEYCMITDDDRQGYRIVCFNCEKLNYQYFMKKEEEIEGSKLSQYFEKETKIILHIVLNGVANGKYKIKARRLNTRSGSVLDEWKHMDMDEHMDLEDIGYLKQICVPRHSLRYTGTSSRLLNLKIELEPHELQYMHIEHV